MSLTCEWANSEDDSLRCRLVSDVEEDLVIFTEPYFALGAGGQRKLEFDRTNGAPMPWAPENVMYYSGQMEDGSCDSGLFGHVGTIFKRERIDALTVLPAGSLLDLSLDIRLVRQNVSAFPAGAWCVRLCMPIKTARELLASAEAHCTGEDIAKLSNLRAVKPTLSLGVTNDRRPEFIDQTDVDDCEYELSMTPGTLTCSNVLILRVPSPPAEAASSAAVRDAR